MELAAICSGGKDSICSIHRAILSGHKIKYLISIQPSSIESYFFHYPNIWLTKLQARALGIAHVFRELKGDLEELGCLRRILAELSPEGVLVGCLASNFQRSKIQQICGELGIQALFPLWGIDPYQHWIWMLNHGYEIMITSVAAQGLTREWLGKLMDLDRIQQLRKLSIQHGFDLGFEGGEGETLVLDMPLFREKIRIISQHEIWDHKLQAGYIQIERAELIPKKNLSSIGGN